MYIYIYVYTYIYIYIYIYHLHHQQKHHSAALVVEGERFSLPFPYLAKLASERKNTPLISVHRSLAPLLFYPGKSKE